MPCLVREKLFLGNIEDAAQVLQNGDGEITHVLSILSSASISFFSEWRSSVAINTKNINIVYTGDEDESGGFSDTTVPPKKINYSLEYAGKNLELVRMAVPLGDMERENLLDSLDVCLKFIDDSRSEGSILVHCFAGVSRSASVITAYLMRTEQLSLEDALYSLRQSSMSVCPNDGFMKQLKMFEEMEFKVDRSSSIYKAYHMKVLGHCYERGERIDYLKFSADPETEGNKETQNAEMKRKITYRCKKCRRLVALQENVLDHVPGKDKTSFHWRHKRESADELPECSSIFIEPLRWMTSVEDGAVEGKLCCRHCNARLGYFNWAGSQCSCTAWITPAFQLHKCKVDTQTLDL